MELKRNVVVFYDDSPSFIEEYSHVLQANGFVVEIFKSADDLLERVIANNKDICLIVSELIVSGYGNGFRGKRVSKYENCALYLLDEFDSSPSRDELSKIPKIVFTSWDHVKQGRMFCYTKTDRRFKLFLKKSDIVPSQFLQMVKGLVK